MLRLVLACLGLLLLSLSVQAHDEEILFNKVNLEAEARREVPNDEMTVLLTVEEQGGKPAELAERVNSDMAWALERAKEDPAIEAETHGYSTYPLYKNGTITGWRVRQELQLKSQEFSKLTELLGRLQERLQIMRMGFNPSPETREKHQNELISEAMERFRNRVKIIQQQMEGRDYRIVNLNVNTSGFGFPRPLMAAELSRAKADTASAPAVEGGKSEVTVTVSGSVQFY